QLIPVREGADTHDSPLGTGYPPYRYPGRKDAPMSGGQDEIAVRDRRLAVDVLEPGQIAVVSGEDRAPPTLADDHRHLGLEVGDQEHAGGAARNLGDPADEALAVDHGLPGGHPFAGAGIYEDGPDESAPGIGDHTGGDHRHRGLRLEAQQLPQRLDLAVEPVGMQLPATEPLVLRS